MRRNPITTRFMIIIAALFLLPLSAFAEIKTVTQTVQQSIGSNQSPDDARTAGIAKAKREALEQFGTYIESITIVKNSHLDSDEIIALTAGVTKAEVIKQKNYVDGDAFGIEITVKVELDTDVLEKSLKSLLADRNHLKDLTATRVREKKLLAQIAELQKQDKKKGKTKQQNAKLKKNFQSASQGLTAVEWFDKAMTLWQGEKFSDPEAAIGYLDKAIRLNPDLAQAFIGRGAAYSDLKQEQRAITDYDQAIRLKPDYEYAYYNRGNAYSSLKQYQRAIADYDQTIRLKPDAVKAINNRGVAYRSLKQYKRAIANYDQAIRLKPDFVEAFYNRGNAYNDLEQYQRAIADYDEAIRLKPDDAKAFIRRGIVYKNLKQVQRAMSDLNQAIRLSPDDDEAFSFRGITYISSGNDIAGCEDLRTACAKGVCAVLEAAKGQGLCQQGLTAVEWLDKALSLLQDRKHSDPEEAIGYLDKAISLNPDYAEAFYNRGTVYSDLKKYQRAIADFDSAIRLKPDYAGAYNNRGNAYMHLEQYQRAIADSDQAIRLNPDLANAFNNRGLAYILSDNIAGCKDLRTACRMGVCVGLEAANSGGLCQ